MWLMSEFVFKEVLNILEYGYYYCVNCYQYPKGYV